MDDSDSPTVCILLLGDPGCGKSTLLARLSRGQTSSESAGPLPILHDLDQPFIFTISMYNRPYRFEFFDTASPENYTLLRPDFVILCYDITDRRSLINIQQVWRKDITRHYSVDGEDVPVMLLGLKRDARVEELGVIYPQEGYRIAQEMRCDRYAECSAVTGELISEVFEDIARTAAKTKTEAGGLTQGGCTLM
ncbi:MAG: hypothetical protein L6R37_002382 [Teloschistes peruensis]|nr:MAG: hypothetical protein L6R37_002382 [Teloschistes peruensis]